MKLQIPDDPLLFALQTDFHRLRRHRTAKNMFLNAAQPPPRPLVARGRMSLSPQPSRPRSRQFFCYNRQQPVVPSQRVLSPVSPAVLSVPQPTECNVFPRERQGHHPTVLLPAVAVEVKGPRRPSAPCGIWGDGTELDAVDDSNADPTLERQIHVQATGVHEGGTVKRFETEGKGERHPSVRVLGSPMRMLALVQGRLRTGRSTLPSFENRT